VAAAAYYVTAAITALCAVWFLRSGIQQWHGKGRPASYWLQNGLMDDQTQAGYDRGSVVLGVMSACFTVLLGGAAVAGLPRHSAPAAEIAVFVVAIAGILITVAAFLGIMWFNQPKFLVPPHLRGQPGSLAGRRQEKHGAGHHGKPAERRTP
jgi:hypothetical protein